MENSPERSIYRLEKQVKILIGLITALVIVFLFTASDSSHVSQIINCQQRKIIDTDGNEIAMLGVDKDGSRGLFVYDKSGKLRLTTIHGTTQTALYLFDSTETIRVVVAQYAHWGGGFALHGEKSIGSTVLYHKNSGSLTFYGDDGIVLNKEMGEENVDSKND